MKKTKKKRIFKAMVNIFEYTIVIGTVGILAWVLLCEMVKFAIN